MNKTVEFFFDLGSPAAYLAWTQLPALCERAGAELRYRPMLLGGVFQATGNSSPATVPAKGRYMTTDLLRHARRYDVPFAFNPHFPINTLALMRGAVGYQLQQSEEFLRYLNALFKALWVDQRNLGDEAVLAAVLTEAGLDAEQFRAVITDDRVKHALKANTEEAVQRGVFGAPTFFVGDEMFFGQDRLGFVEDALS
ncbi:DSBA oxidoreductase [Stutzerimonas stutzeri]|uniref:2-hydroxychromene-2-carboxylate isomerase n=1 Tax=Stutzerimonas stutzeri TaxID=316 RepID=W8RDD8_STUST|nr:2-hydroxychromene-2-carboxylate isomerase [Stutzerimonas stutzeri]AHL76482.1 DSBA oxidoreductase [Stutzerimonas stutzeri]MCQ4329717.1 2-hydroxychromene-2-carboxylate isomerase [Stutzerimonas stutzeri]